MEVTPAALEASRLFSPYRLQMARQSRGYTKTELSQRLDMSAAALSQFELGQSRPSPATVQRLSSVLSFEPSFFSSATLQRAADQTDDDLVDSYGHFRSRRSLTAIRRRQALTVGHLLRDVTAFLETRVQLPQLRIPRLPAATASDVSLVAARVRSEFGIDAHNPVKGVLSLLETCGVMCARYPMEDIDVSAFSVPTEHRSFLVLKHERVAKIDRDRFSSCHELGHLVMHKPGQNLASKVLEDQANKFAADFLMPEKAIRDELLAKVDWSHLLALKQRWGVSMAALLYRSKHLQIMPDSTYVQAMRTMNARGWNRQEPGTVTALEAPVMLKSALSVAHLTEADISLFTGWPEPMIKNLLLGSGDTRPIVRF